VAAGAAKQPWSLSDQLLLAKWFCASVVDGPAPDVLWEMSRCLWSLGGLPELMVPDREGCPHARGGRPTESYAAFCGQLPVGWLFSEPANPQASRSGLNSRR
jgi:hypothetical protein